jgi:quercetin dioxygenase-like cupin family protein
MSHSKDRANPGADALDLPVEDERFGAALLDALSSDVSRPAPRGLRDLLTRAPLRGRLYRFTEPLAALMDVDHATAQQLLDGLDEPEPFEPGPFPGLDIALRHISGGPAVQNAITGFVRIGPGTAFPHHEHLGDEHVLILQGHCVETQTGTVAGPGEVVTRPGGTAHEIEALPGATDLVYLAVVHTGVRIGDTVMGPDSPEL